MNFRKSTLNLFKKLPIFLLLILFISCQNSANKLRTIKSESIGPKNGALLISGSGKNEGMTDEMWKVFFDLAGGKSAKLVVIPTAFDNNSINYDPEFKIIERKFKSLGFNDIQFMHTRGHFNC